MEYALMPSTSTYSSKENGLSILLTEILKSETKMTILGNSHGP
jgi:hypothetical protein